MIPCGRDSNPSYEYFFWKHYLVLPNVQGAQDCAFVDFSNPRDLRHVLHMQRTGTAGTTGVDSELPGRRYAQFQDNKMFLGAGTYDMTPLDSGLPPDSSKSGQPQWRIHASAAETSTSARRTAIKDRSTAFRGALTG